MRTVSDAPRCQHVHDSGHTCGSPALRGQDFCYHHHQIHYPRLLPGQKSYHFRSLDGQSSVELFVRNLFQSYHDGHLNDRQVRTYLYGVQIMAPYICKGRATGGLTAEITPAMQQLLGSADPNLPAAITCTSLDTAVSSAPDTDLPSTRNASSPTEPSRVAGASSSPARSAGYTPKPSLSSPVGTAETAATTAACLDSNSKDPKTQSPNDQIESDHQMKKPPSVASLDLAGFSRLIDRMPGDVLSSAESKRIRKLLKAARAR